MMLLSYIEAWVIELERVVNTYEAAVDEVEEAMDRLDQASASVDSNGQIRQDQDPRQLDNALESAEQVAALVKAVNAALNVAIDAARLVATNAQLDLPLDNGEMPTSDADDQTQPLPRIRAPLVGAQGVVGVQDIVGAVAGFRAAATGPIIHGTLDSEDRENHAVSLEPLSDGSIIVQGKYRVVRLLHRRPRLHLYLAQRLDDRSQPLVAIREIVLAGLSPRVCRQIERAAFEEFVSPRLFGLPHLPGVGDRVCIENERHYLVMQLRPVRGQRQAVAVTLAELLLHQPHWPVWLETETAVEWGIQLCRIVARLHGMGVTLGDLNPATVLVDPQGTAEWAPVLLVSWPPPSQFWQAAATSTSISANRSIHELSAQIFPIAKDFAGNAFTAPETFDGVYDERSDVYSLGAMLYLLLTRYAPTVAPQRLRAEQTGQTANSIKKQGERGIASLRFGSGPLHSADGITLIPPRLFNNQISAELEQVVVRALSLDASSRYSSVVELLGALEAVNPETDFSEVFLAKRNAQRVSRRTKVVEWLRRELSE